MRDTVWRGAPCMDRALADWSVVNKEDITSAGLWLVLTSKQFSSSVGTLWLAWNKSSTSEWPGLLSIKPDFRCALSHPEAAILEERGQAFKCISWFKLNSVIKGREILHLGDLLQWLGTNPPSRGAEGHNLTFKLAVMGKDCQNMNCFSGDSKPDFFNSGKYFKALGAEIESTDIVIPQEDNPTLWLYLSYRRGAIPFQSSETSESLPVAGKRSKYQLRKCHFLATSGLAWVSSLIGLHKTPRVTKLSWVESHMLHLILPFTYPSA